MCKSRSLDNPLNVTSADSAPSSSATHPSGPSVYRGDLDEQSDDDSDGSSALGEEPDIAMIDTDPPAQAEHGMSHTAVPPPGPILVGPVQDLLQISSVYIFSLKLLLSKICHPLKSVQQIMILLQ